MREDKNINKEIKSGFISGRLPKARANHPYMTFLGGDMVTSNPSVARVLEEIGLHYFPDKNQITGIPKKTGSFDLYFNIREYNESGIEELSTHMLNLTVEEDYNPQLKHVDENDPYWKPDEDVYTIAVNQDKKNKLKKDVVAASRRGYEHIEKGKIREDDFYIRYDPKTRWYALAVADGAGKSKYSRKGSRVACRSAVDSCLEQLTEQSRTLRKLTVRYTWRKTNQISREIMSRLHDIIASSVTDAYEDIAAEAKKFRRHPQDYATTLLMCICKKFEFGWLIGAYGVGDGAICVYHKDNWYTNLMTGNEHPSMKFFLTTPEILQPSGMERRIRFTIVDDFSALFLMTNGVKDPKFENKTNMPGLELWNKFWEDISTQVDFSGKLNDVGEDLLEWLDFWAPGKYDDRTIAMVI